jgi:hypothetical protein
MAFGSEAMDQPVFEYIFDQNLGMVEVKSGNETRQIFDTQAKIAGIPGPFYDAYLTHLSHQVRYWSGSAWGATPVSVHQ